MRTGGGAGRPGGAAEEDDGGGEDGGKDADDGEAGSRLPVGLGRKCFRFRDFTRSGPSNQQPMQNVFYAFIT